MAANPIRKAHSPRIVRARAINDRVSSSWAFDSCHICGFHGKDAWPVCWNDKRCMDVRRWIESASISISSEVETMRAMHARIFPTVAGLSILARFAATASEAVEIDDVCTKCRVAPNRPGGRYCIACHRSYQRTWREQRGDSSIAAAESLIARLEAHNPDARLIDDAISFLNRVIESRRRIHK